jgi:dienelactone hydrolase
MLRTLVLVAGLGLVPKPALAPPVPVVLNASDGVSIFATAYDGPTPLSPVILLFHQAGSSKSEYATIAPRLQMLGYASLAIDQRSGGDFYSPPNQTVQKLGKSASDFRAVLPDMDAALAWAKKTHPHAPIFAWGSSYSAELVFALAAAHPRDIKAVLSFSPGEYVLENRRLARDAAARVTCPVFIDSAADADEEHNAKTILASVRSTDKMAFVPHAGIHGSSTLRDDRDAAGSAENWDAVTRFLTHVTATLAR